MSLKFWEKIGIIVAVLATFVGFVWWAACFSNQNESVVTNATALETRICSLEKMKKSFDRLEIKTQGLAGWIDRNRVLPERLARMETQLDNLSVQLAAFNRNFEDIRIFLLTQNHRKKVGQQ